MDYKESEDERIRKEIIDVIRHSVNSMPADKFNERIAWLEKQGEHKVSDNVEPKFKVGNWVMFNNKHQSIYQVEKIKDGYYILRHTYGGTFRVCVLHDESLRLWTIQDAKDGDVLIDKSGSRECPFIFKETKPSDIKTDMLNPLTVLGYCGIGGAGFTKGSGWGDTANCIYYPATKEQCDLLFTKMKEAGYEWNAERKELKENGNNSD